MSIGPGGIYGGSFAWLTHGGHGEQFCLRSHSVSLLLENPKSGKYSQHLAQRPHFINEDIEFQKGKKPRLPALGGSPCKLQTASPHLRGHGSTKGGISASAHLAKIPACTLHSRILLYFNIKLRFYYYSGSIGQQVRRQLSSKDRSTTDLKRKPLTFHGEATQQAPRSGGCRGGSRRVNSMIWSLYCGCHGRNT